MASTTQNSIVVDYDISNDLIPQVHLRTIGDDSDRTISLGVGEQIDWRIFPDKYCVGYHAPERGRSYLACPAQASLLSGIQCKDCRSRDSLIPCMICNGNECRAVATVRDHCSGSETAIYIATFGDNFKVGVSNRDRLMKRWLEQGADVGIEVAIAPDAKTARVVESNVSKIFSIPKSVRTQTKSEQLKTPSPSIFVRLNDLAERVSVRIIGDYPECGDGNRKAVNLGRFYGGVYSSAPFAFSPPSNAFSLSGTLVGMKGPLFFFEAGICYFLDFRTLKARRIVVSCLA